MLSLLRGPAGRPAGLRLATNRLLREPLVCAWQRQGAWYSKVSESQSPWSARGGGSQRPARRFEFEPSRFRGRRGPSGGSQTQRGRYGMRKGGIDFENIHDEILEGTAETRADYVTKFADLTSKELVSPTIVDTLTGSMGLETMTRVQSRTINETLSGIDIIGQARTGTGKTLAFLIPVLQKIIAKDEKLGQIRRWRTSTGPDIRAVIISPTRELAEQIAAEAKRLVAKTSVVVQCAVGGTLKRQGMAQIMRNGCHILVGTPGRLKDIFSDPRYDLDLSKVHSFVLDEADRLLDSGFLPDIEELASALPPKETRQNMLFSATVPREVLSLARNMLNSNSRFVQTIQKGEVQTHEKIPQNIVVCNAQENKLPALLEMMANYRASTVQTPFKALVFLNSTAETHLYASLFRTFQKGSEQSLRLPIYEMHSNLTQAVRTSTSDRFRGATQGVMFTTDVSARGMDYPNVSHVIQLGLPRSRDFYIHRIGRTGRGEKSGESWLLLAPYELGVARKFLRGLPLKEFEDLAAATADMKDFDALPSGVQETIQLGQSAGKKVGYQVLAEAYRGCLGFLSWVSDKKELTEQLANEYVRSFGMERPPSINPDLAWKLGVSQYVDTDRTRRPSSRDDEGLSRSPSFRSSSYRGRTSRYSRRDDSPIRQFENRESRWMREEV